MNLVSCCRWMPNSTMSTTPSFLTPRTPVLRYVSSLCRNASAQYHLREFECFNSRHPGPWRAWKGGSELRLLTSDPWGPWKHQKSHQAIAPAALGGCGGLGQLWEALAELMSSQPSLKNIRRCLWRKQKAPAGASTCSTGLVYTKRYKEFLKKTSSPCGSVRPQHRTCIHPKKKEGVFSKKGNKTKPGLPRTYEWFVFENSNVRY